MIKKVLSIDQMRHLQGLGVDTSKASMKLISNIPSVDCEYNEDCNPDNFHYVAVEQSFYAKQYNECGNTFTLQDIIDKLPCFIDTYVLTLQKLASTYTCLYMEPYSRSILVLIENKELIDAAYDMLCWCIENGYIKKESE